MAEPVVPSQSLQRSRNEPVGQIMLGEMGIEPFLISSSMIGVLAQRLARMICSHCKESYAPPPEALHRLGLKPDEGEDVVFYQGKGCNRCKSTGYKGRIGIFELMVMSEAISELVLKGVADGDRIRVLTTAQSVSRWMRAWRTDEVRMRASLAPAAIRVCQRVGVTQWT